MYIYSHHSADWTEKHLHRVKRDIITEIWQQEHWIIQFIIAFIYWIYECWIASEMWISNEEQRRCTYDRQIRKEVLKNIQKSPACEIFC